MNYKPEEYSIKLKRVYKDISEMKGSKGKNSFLIPHVIVRVHLFTLEFYQLYIKLL